MRACLLDTNLLVLLTVGRASPAFVEVHKRTRSYRSEDLPLLEELLAKAARIVTTPHVLSETSNLIRQFQEPGRGRIVEAFRDFAFQAEETHVPCAEAFAQPDFVRLGLTDAGILAALRDDVGLVTDDLDLYLASVTAGRDAINFTHERARRFG
ncbi:putative nucleic acid-binding protein [Methylorubrum rhodinum]|uniref:Putative nucleic acid-binding protein n=1 Tax=Methylorubrum rhodinum TaxID=29428 RepID=A0A840ZI36_9HYPH|nr:hypothetical protein [Methylorubrum rhodinum]MBB5757569.1 putative nucleic acid-binding protein [Methylorubrum rhodinum]